MNNMTPESEYHIALAATTSFLHLADSQPGDMANGSSCASSASYVIVDKTTGNSFAPQREWIETPGLLRHRHREL
jgi:hypothetical protein